MKFCQPVIVGNKYNFTFILQHQKTSITFNNNSKFTPNPFIISTIVFYSPIPTTYFLPHQKTLIRTLQTFKTKLLFQRIEERRTTPYFLIARARARHSNHNNRYCVHAMFRPVSPLPCFQPSKCTWAPFQ